MEVSKGHSKSRKKKQRTKKLSKEEMLKTTKKSIELPEKFEHITTSATISIKNGKAKILSTTLTPLSEEALEYVYKTQVYKTSVYSDRESCMGNPDVGAVIARWVSKNTGREIPRSNNNSTKRKSRTHIYFDDIDERAKKFLCLGQKEKIQREEVQTEQIQEELKKKEVQIEETQKEEIQRKEIRKEDLEA